MQADDSSGFSCLKDWIIFLTVRSTVAVIVSERRIDGGGVCDFFHATVHKSWPAMLLC